MEVADAGAAARHRRAGSDGSPRTRGEGVAAGERGRPQSVRGFRSGGARPPRERDCAAAAAMPVPHDEPSRHS